MFAITSGLNHNTVKRLKHTWEKIHPKYIKSFEEMYSLMDPSMNFRKYRNLITSVTVCILKMKLNLTEYTDDIYR